MHRVTKPLSSPTTSFITARKPSSRADHLARCASEVGFHTIHGGTYNHGVPIEEVCALLTSLRMVEVRFMLRLVPEMMLDFQAARVRVQAEREMQARVAAMVTMPDIVQATAAAPSTAQVRRACRASPRLYPSFFSCRGPTIRDCPRQGCVMHPRNAASEFWDFMKAR